MGPPVPAPSVSLMRRVAPSPQPFPVLDAQSNFGGHHAQSNWGMVPLPDADAQPHVGPPVDYQSPAAHRFQPLTEDSMTNYHPAIGVQGYSDASPHNYALPDYHMGPPTDRGTGPSHPLPEHSMTVDHPYVINSGYSRVPTPHSHSATVTPPRINPRHPTPRASPQVYPETLVTPTRQISGLPPSCSMRAAERNISSAVQYLGDIPANQLMHQYGMAPGTEAEGLNQTRGNIQSVSSTHLCAYLMLTHDKP